MEEWEVIGEWAKTKSEMGDEVGGSGWVLDRKSRESGTAAR